MSREDDIRKAFDGLLGRMEGVEAQRSPAASRRKIRDREEFRMGIRFMTDVYHERTMTEEEWAAKYPEDHKRLLEICGVAVPTK